MSYNIRHGRGIDNVQMFSRTVREINNSSPDILGINELDCYNPRSKWQNQPRKIARVLGFNYIFQPTLNMGIARYGNGLFSRWPIVEYKLHELPAFKEPRGCIEAIVNSPQGNFKVMVLHLGLDNKEQEEQLIKVAQLVGESEIPTLLMGDFNRLLAEDILILGLVDTFAQAGEAPGYTFPADYPAYRIDYILCSRHFQVEKAYNLSSMASDHLPVIALVKLRKD